MAFFSSSSMAASLARVAGSSRVATRQCRSSSVRCNLSTRTLVDTAPRRTATVAAASERAKASSSLTSQGHESKRKGAARTLTTSARARLPSDDPGGKPIPTDGSYRTVYDDFNNITASEEQQLSIHSMGDSTFTMTDGLVAHTPILMINKQVLLWDAPALGGKDAQGNDVLVMPTGRGWEAWTDDVWRVFEVVQPRPEILIFGTGKTVLPVPAHIKRYLNKLGIQIEAHSSRNACSTYNMLAEEERLVAAAILPNVRKPTERVLATEKPLESA